jgi:hypothetical protein
MHLHRARLTPLPRSSSPLLLRVSGSFSGKPAAPFRQTRDGGLAVTAGAPTNPDPRTCPSDRLTAFRGWPRKAVRRDVHSTNDSKGAVFFARERYAMGQTNEGGLLSNLAAPSCGPGIRRLIGTPLGWNPSKEERSKSQ